MPDRPATPPARTRLPSLDILRGVAIAWVIAFHLSTDVVGFDPLEDYYTDITDNLGDIPALLAALWSLFLRLGYQGVPLFMMASGFAMTLTAIRAGGVSLAPASLLTFWLRRLRTLMAPYWIGFALAVGAIALLAAVRMIDSGNSFSTEWRSGTKVGEAPYLIDGQLLLAGLTLLPRGWRIEWIFAPSPSLWFVLLFVQFYLAFPLLYRVLERIGAWPFVLGALVVTLLAKWPIVLSERGYGLLFHWWIDNNYLPFNLFTFALGMGLAWAYVHHRATMQSYTSGWFNAGLLIYAGLIVHTIGSLAQGRSGANGIVASPMIVLGLTMIVLPWLMNAPEGEPRHAAVAALAWLGTFSYPILIASDPLRFLIGTLHSLDAPVAVWAAFWVLYLPALLLLARGVDAIARRVPELRRSSAPAAKAASSQ